MCKCEMKSESSKEWNVNEFCSGRAEKTFVFKSAKQIHSLSKGKWMKFNRPIEESALKWGKQTHDKSMLTLDDDDYDDGIAVLCIV